jgi:hypothetical protein
MSTRTPFPTATAFRNKALAIFIVGINFAVADETLAIPVNREILTWDCAAGTHLRRLNLPALPNGCVLISLIASDQL